MAPMAAAHHVRTVGGMITRIQHEATLARAEELRREGPRCMSSPGGRAATA
jgi:hypothetical protein